MSDAIKRSRVHESVNATMVRMLSELDSEYALTPMQCRSWKNQRTHSTVEIPAFIALMKTQGMRKDYTSKLPKLKE
jgi:hypothetical protein